MLVKGFDVGTSTEDITAHCATKGKVLGIELRGKFTALVTYGSEKAAANAVEALEKSTIPGNSRFINCMLKNVPGTVVPDEPPKASKASKGNGKGGKGKAVAPMMALPSSRPMMKPTQAPQYKHQSSAQSSATGATGTVVTVRGFDFGTTDADIRKHFARVGKISSVEITGNGGSAAVTFTKPGAAKNAVEQLDKSIIEGNARYVEVKIRGGANANQQASPAYAMPAHMPAHAIWTPQGVWVPTGAVSGGGGGGKSGQNAASKATKRSSKVVNVRGFDFETTEEAVMEHFSKVGKVVSVEMKGKNGGSAILTFSSPKAAEKAEAQLNKTIIVGNTRYIEVKLKYGEHTEKLNNGNAAAEQPTKTKKRKARDQRPPDDAADEAAADDGCRVLVRGFDKGTSVEAVVDHCSSAGTIVSSKAAFRHAVFVTYGSPEEAQDAVERLAKSVIDGNTRYIDLKIDQGAEGPRKKRKF